MKPVIIIAITFVLLIPVSVFADFFITAEIADVLNNSPDYVDVSALGIPSNNYEITWEGNKYELEKILGKELFEHYEPIVSVDAIYDSRTSTSLAFKELDKLPAIMNNYSYEKYRHNHEIQIELIKTMDFLSDEEKVDFIYDREVRNWNAIVSHYEYSNQKFVDQVKEFYLYLDEKGEIYRQAENAYQQEQEALQKIQKELEIKELEEKQKIREELGMKESEPEPIHPKSRHNQKELIEF